MQEPRQEAMEKVLTELSTSDSHFFMLGAKEILDIFGPIENNNNNAAADDDDEDDDHAFQNNATYDCSSFYKELTDICRNNIHITYLNLDLIAVALVTTDDHNNNNNNNGDNDIDASNYLNLQEFWAAFGMLPHLETVFVFASNSNREDEQNAMQRLDILGLAALLQANKDHLPNPRLNSLEIRGDDNTSLGNWPKSMPELAKGLSNHPTLSNISWIHFGESTLSEGPEIWEAFGSLPNLSSLSLTRRLDMNNGRASGEFVYRMFADVKGEPSTTSLRNLTLHNFDFLTTTKEFWESLPPSLEKMRLSLCTFQTRDSSSALHISHLPKQLLELDQLRWKTIESSPNNTSDDDMPPSKKTRPFCGLLAASLVANNSDESFKNTKRQRLMTEEVRIIELNPDHFEDASTFISRALDDSSFFCNLKSMDLRLEYVGDDILIPTTYFTEIQASLQNNHTLERFTLHSTPPFEPGGVAALAAGIRQSRNLQGVVLGFYAGGSVSSAQTATAAELIEIGKAVQFHPTIKQVYLGSCFTFEQQARIVESLQGNSTLKSLCLQNHSLDQNSITEEMWEPFQLAIERLYGLENICVYGASDAQYEQADVVVKLNSAGRKYILGNTHSNAGSETTTGLDVLVEVRDDIDCLYFHLRENVGQLFQEARMVEDETRHLIKE